MPLIDDLILRADFTIVARERFKDGEPNDFLTEIRGVLFIEDDIGNATVIGSMTGTYVDIASGRFNQDNHSRFDLFDCDSDEYAEAYKAIFDPSTDDYWEEFEDALSAGHNVMVLDEMTVERQDNQIPLRFLKLIVDLTAAGAGIVIALPDSGVPVLEIRALGFFPSPRVPGHFLLNRAAPFQGAVIGIQSSAEDSTAH